MKIHTQSPILVSTTRKGLKKFWRCRIMKEGKNFYLSSESWQELAGGGESKHNTSVPYLVEPKNVGKANETTPEQQANLEMESLINHQKVAKDYSEIGKKKEAKKIPLPMLAKDYKEQRKKIVYPAYVQRKLNGNRMGFDGDYAQSRGGKQILPEVVEHLKFDTEGYILDGELMLPGNPLLQVSVAAIKKFRPDTSPTLIYHVYDVMIEGVPFEERLKILKKLSKKFPKNVKLVETILVENHDEMVKLHREFVSEGQGYEGTIIRNKDGLYQFGHRSNDLQKYKDFIDEEFEIVNVEDGGGLYEGCAKFVCVTKDGKEFRSNPEGSIEYKKQLYRDRKKLIGKMLTVRYFDKSLDGIPGINVGVVVRDYE